MNNTITTGYELNTAAGDVLEVKLSDDGSHPVLYFTKQGQSQVALDLTAQEERRFLNIITLLAQAFAAAQS